MKKPAWLNKKINLNVCRDIKELSRNLKLHTVCEEALCPNISECFCNGTATFMILGNICTRNCRFCAITKGVPERIDKEEPYRVKEAVRKLGLNYVVVTSPSRDDLDDGGAQMFIRTVREIKELDSCPKVEILIPDFLGKENLLRKTAECGADVLAHNLETVPALYPRIRKEADYQRSLKVLKTIGNIKVRPLLKSGIMLGLGESTEEVINVLGDLRKVNCDFLTLGQYLPPSLKSYAVKEYITLEKFRCLEKKALAMGFKKVKSSPYTRSSYLAYI